MATSNQQVEANKMSILKYGLPLDLVNFVKNELVKNVEIDITALFNKAKSYPQFKDYDFNVIDISDLAYHLPT